jgi:hypothetical protein
MLSSDAVYPPSIGMSSLGFEHGEALLNVDFPPQVKANIATGTGHFTLWPAAPELDIWSPSVN